MANPTDPPWVPAGPPGPPFVDNVSTPDPAAMALVVNCGAAGGAFQTTCGEVANMESLLTYANAQAIAAINAAAVVTGNAAKHGGQGGGPSGPSVTPPFLPPPVDTPPSVPPSRHGPPPNVNPNAGK